MKLFRVDGPIYNFMDTLKNLFLINVCLILCSIPIVTFGAAVVAAYDVALRMVKNEEGYVMKQFFQAFKANLKQGCILGLITLGCMEVLWLDYQLVTKLDDVSIFVIMIGIVSAFIFFFSLLYAYPQVARYNNKLPRILKNSFRISMKYIFRTVILVVVLALEIAASMWNMTTLFIAVLIGPAFYIYTTSYMANAIFNDLEKEAKS